MILLAFRHGLRASDLCSLRLSWRPRLRPRAASIRLADHRPDRFSNQAAASFAIQSSASTSVLKPVMCSFCRLGQVPTTCH